MTIKKKPTSKKKSIRKKSASNKAARSKARKAIKKKASKKKMPAKKKMAAKRKKITQKEPIRKEILKKELSTKRVFHFVDTEKNIDQVSREVFKNKNIEFHYPIGYNGGAKYKTIRKFIYEGFGKKLPVGVIKAPTRGLGFTKTMKPLVALLEEEYSFKAIRIVKKGNNDLSKKAWELTLNEVTLTKLQKVFANNYDKQKAENLILATEQLHKIFPNKTKAPRKKYIKNSVQIALSPWDQSLDEFSDSDKETIKDLFDKLSLTDDFLSSEAILKTKTTIDNRYIDDVIDQFQTLMLQKTETDNLEKKWQRLMKKHSWIFSFIFSFPIILFEDEAYVGGKNLSNRNGKITDFLVKNKLTDNVAFIEIKTHQTQLVKRGKAYRGTDVFAMSSDLSGGISQVLNQRDNFQKEFAIHKMKSDNNLETFNSKCVVLMGSLGNLTKNQLGSFELFRSNSKDVEIFTFDELLERFKNLKSLMSGSVKE